MAGDTFNGMQVIDDDSSEGENTSMIIFEKEDTIPHEPSRDKVKSNYLTVAGYSIPIPNIVGKFQDNRRYIEETKRYRETLRNEFLPLIAKRLEENYRSRYDINRAFHTISITAQFQQLELHNDVQEYINTGRSLSAQGKTKQNMNDAERALMSQLYNNPNVKEYIRVRDERRLVAAEYKELDEDTSKLKAVYLEAMRRIDPKVKIEDLEQSIQYKGLLRRDNELFVEYAERMCALLPERSNNFLKGVEQKDKELRTTNMHLYEEIDVSLNKLTESRVKLKDIDRFGLVSPQYSESRYMIFQAYGVLNPLSLAELDETIETVRPVFESYNNSNPESKDAKFYGEVLSVYISRRQSIMRLQELLDQRNLLLGVRAMDIVLARAYESEFIKFSQGLEEGKKVLEKFS